MTPRSAREPSSIRKISYKQTADRKTTDWIDADILSAEWLREKMKQINLYSDGSHDQWDVHAAWRQEAIHWQVQVGAVPPSGCLSGVADSVGGVVQ
jgi:hypothetical protein